MRLPQKLSIYLICKIFFFIMHNLSYKSIKILECHHQNFTLRIDEKSVDPYKQNCNLFRNS